MLGHLGARLSHLSLPCACIALLTFAAHVLNIRHLLGERLSIEPLHAHVLMEMKSGNFMVSWSTVPQNSLEIPGSLVPWAILYFLYTIFLCILIQRLMGIARINYCVYPIIFKLTHFSKKLWMGNGINKANKCILVHML